MTRKCYTKALIPTSSNMKGLLLQKHCSDVLTLAFRCHKEQQLSDLHYILNAAL